ncbi:MAG: hypothetical protein IAI49_00385, partial [Candidatus Eremiobacteraeota bacterium]|nr:hypothetical protein [Candidatus Eremiobacteraeota bacterium]
MTRAFGALSLSLAAFAFPSVAAASQSPPAVSASPTPAPARAERFSIHAQSTDVQQYHGAFPAAYDGPQSIASKPDTAKTIDGTLYLGARVGAHTE